MAPTQDLELLEEVSQLRHQKRRRSEVARFASKRGVVAVALLGALGLGVLPATDPAAVETALPPVAATSTARESGESSTSSPGERDADVVDLSGAELVHHIPPHIAGMRCGWRIGWWYFLRRGGASTAQHCWYLWQHALNYRW